MASDIDQLNWAVKAFATYACSEVEANRKLVLRSLGAISRSREALARLSQAVDVAEQRDHFFGKTAGQIAYQNSEAGAGYAPMERSNA